jgi:hypothetical protein
MPTADLLNLLSLHHANAEQSDRGNPLTRPLADLIDRNPALDTSNSFFGPKQLLSGSYHLAMCTLPVLRERGPNGTVEWLRKILAVERTAIRAVVEVVGIELDRVIRFSNGVILQPLAQAGETRNMTALQVGYDQPLNTFARFHHAPVVVSFDKMYSRQREYDYRAFDQEANPIENLLQALATSGKLAPVAGFRWIEFVDPDLELACFGGWGGTQQGDFRHTEKLEDEDIEWAERFLLLTGNVAARCKIAAYRLSAAQRRRFSDNVERAIDVSIALEALLGERSARTELRFRIAMRAAFLLGNTPQARLPIMEVLKKFYDLRSGVVHGAKHVVTQNEIDLIDEAQELCGKVLRVLVDLRREPDFAAVDAGGTP